MQFSSVTGHADLKKRLIRNVTESRVSHALLLSGPEGCGSLPLAIAYAQYVACENRNEEDSCGQCPACIKIQKLIHPDLHFSLPVNQEGDTKTLHTRPFLAQWREQFLKNPWLGLDDWVTTLDIGNKQPFISNYEAHELIRTLQLKSFESEYKFLIIWLPEKMRAEAANSLLKTLEEPPDKTLIMLVSQDYDSLLKTIQSRTQLVKVSRLSLEDSATVLAKLTGQPAERCRLATGIAEGNVVQARRLLENSEEADAQLELFRNWMLGCYGFNIQELLKITELFARESREWQKSFFTYALYMIRQVLLMNHRRELNRVTPNEETFIEKFRRFFHPGNYEIIGNHINEAIVHVERNAHGKILFFDLSLQIADVFRKEKN